MSNKLKKDIDMKSEVQMKNTCLNLKNRQNFTKVYLYSQKNKKLLMEKKALKNNEERIIIIISISQF